METELKFQVPAARSVALRRAVATATARTTRLQAVYFDTPDLVLAQAGLALRLRKEGRVWVQTLKGRGDGIATRLEHEVPLGPARAAPALDVQRHAGTPAGQALAEVLATVQAAAGAAASLAPLYRTDMRRLHRCVRHGGALIEIAHDQGWLIAGEGLEERRRAVDEIEFELKGGPPAALPAMAGRWAARFGLWWDVRTKAEQGTRLALDRAVVPAVKARRFASPSGGDTRDFFVAAVQAALAQALPNAAELAGGSGSAEHLHQLRLGLRRLRAALRLMAPWSGDAEAALALDAAWRGPFGVLGQARDADVRALALQPRLDAAGAPAFAWSTQEPAPDAGECVRGADFNALLMRSLALRLASPGGDAPVACGPAARALLRPAWKRMQRDAAAFATADTQARHATRKHLKRLRHGLEFSAVLLRPKAGRAALKALGKALRALGELNDTELAIAACQGEAAGQPQAWFAVGWLSAQRTALLAQADAALQALRRVRRPWQGG